MASQSGIICIAIFILVRPRDVIRIFHTEGAEKVHERLEMHLVYNWVVSFRIAGVENNATVAAMVHPQTYFLKSR